MALARNDVIDIAVRQCINDGSIRFCVDWHKPKVIVTCAARDHINWFVTKICSTGLFH